MSAWDGRGGTGPGPAARDRSGSLGDLKCSPIESQLLNQMNFAVREIAGCCLLLFEKY